MDNRHPPLHEIARLVTLYRARNVKPYQWDSVADAFDHAAVELYRARLPQLRAAYAYGCALRHHIHRADPVAAGAVAFVLRADGQSPLIVGRFIVPGYRGEIAVDDDPRAALRRALAALRPPYDTPQRTMGLMLKAWGLWVTGSTCRELSWREDAPIPRVAGWPSFAIPTPGERPQ